jgi:hypothetical protein
MKPMEIERYCSQHPDVTAMIVLQEPEPESGEHKVLRYGL